MFGNNCCEDAAAHVESGRQAHKPGFRGRDKVVKDAVGHSLVECALVAVGPDVQFEALEFDTAAVSNVIEVQGSEIRLTGLRTQAGKLRNLHSDQKIPFRIRIGEGFESGVGILRHLFA